MSREKINVGLTQIEFPEHRFDTLDGGVELYNTLRAFAKRVSDDAIALRVFNLQLAPEQTTEVSHNIPLPELTIRVFTVSGSEMPRKIFKDILEITQISQTKIRVKNISQANQIFLLAVIGLPQAFRNIQLEHVETAPTPKNHYCIIYYDGNDINAKMPDGTTLSLSSLVNVPVGAILQYQSIGSVPPAGFLFCDGSAVSRTAYARLFGVIGTIYGAGDNSTTFNLPNIQNAIIKF